MWWAKHCGRWVARDQSVASAIAIALFLGAWLTIDAGSPSVDAKLTPISYDTAVAGDAPMVWWRLNSGAVVPDASGNGITAAGTSGNTAGSLVGDADTASWFQTSTQSNVESVIADAGTEAPFALADGARSVEAWIRMRGAATDYAQIVTWGSGNNQFTVTADDDFVSVDVGPETLVMPANKDLDDGRWHHVVVTYNGDEFTSFVDGAQTTSAAPAAPLTTAAGRITAGFGNSWVQVGLDELAIYPRALSSTEIGEHFAASGNQYLPAPASVTATSSPSSGSVQVDWAAVSVPMPSGFEAVDQYRVELIEEATGDLHGARSIARTSTSTILTGIAPGTYRAQVRAVNGFGPGPYATSSPVSVTGGAPTYASVIAADRPLLWWRLGDTSGVTADASGNNLDGTGTTGNTPGVLAADTDTASWFRTSSKSNHAYVWAKRRTTAPFAMGDAARSIEAWIHTRGTADYSRIVTWGSGNNQFLVQADGQTVSVDVGPQTLVLQAGKNLDDGSWHHVVVTYDGDRFFLYVDGTETDTAAPAASLTTVADRIVAGFGNSHVHLYMDEFAIYSRALTARQVSNHYVAGTVLPVVDGRSQGARS